MSFEDSSVYPHSCAHTRTRSHTHGHTHIHVHTCTHSHTPYTHTLAHTQSHSHTQGKLAAPAAGLQGHEVARTVVPIQHLSPGPRQPGITPASKPATWTALGDKRKSPEVGGGGGERRLLQTPRCRTDGSDPRLEEECLLHSWSWPLSPLVTPLPTHPPARAWWVTAPRCLACSLWSLRTSALNSNRALPCCVTLSQEQHLSVLAFAMVVAKDGGTRFVESLGDACCGMMRPNGSVLTGPSREGRWGGAPDNCPRGGGGGL